MQRVRVWLIAAGVSLGISLNVVAAPQLMTPRPPVFNGADIAENWEWRSMAIHSHSWWLSEQFPRARVTNAGFVTPLGNPEALEVGMFFEQWADEFRTLTIDTTQPPLDVSDMDLRESLREHQKVYSRIHCRSGQEMEKRDTCYYFVAWSEQFLPEGDPTFIGVQTSDRQDDEEMALVEENLLRHISPVDLREILTIDEIRVP